MSTDIASHSFTSPRPSSVFFLMTVRLCEQLCVFMSLPLVHSFPEAVYEHQKGMLQLCGIAFPPTKGPVTLWVIWLCDREIPKEWTHNEYKTKLPLETNSPWGRQVFYVVIICPAGLVWSVTSKLKAHRMSVPWSATHYMPLSAIPQVRIHCFVLCSVRL